MAYFIGFVLLLFFISVCGGGAVFILHGVPGNQNQYLSYLKRKVKALQFWVPGNCCYRDFRIVYGQVKWVSLGITVERLRCARCVVPKCADCPPCHRAISFKIFIFSSGGNMPFDCKAHVVETMIFFGHLKPWKKDNEFFYFYLLLSSTCKIFATKVSLRLSLCHCLLRRVYHFCILSG